MNVNKVTRKTTSGAQVLIDLTMLTVTPETLAEGVIAINAAGELIVGTLKAGGGTSSEVDIAAIGYTDNARWSTSSGEIRTGVTGFTAINLVEFERPAGETLTIELSGIDWSVNTNCAIVWYKDGTLTWANQFDGADHNYTNLGMVFTNGDNGTVTITLSDPTDSTYAGINGFKVCGYGAGADAAITISTV